MRILKISVKIVLLFFVFVGCTTTKKDKSTNSKIFSNYSFYQRGLASFYDYKWAGRKTASGDKFNPNKLTAASKTLPFKSIVMVKDVRTGKSVFVEINDRGPYVEDRVIDLSAAAAKKLGITKKGIAKVDIYIVSN
jgi:rare lipoprotein A